MMLMTIMSHTNHPFPTTTITMNNNFDESDGPTLDDMIRINQYYYGTSLLEPNLIESSLSRHVSFSLIITVNHQYQYENNFHHNETVIYLDISNHPILNTLTLEHSSSKKPTMTTMMLSRNYHHHHLIQVSSGS
jgi:hypothetical protein